MTRITAVAATDITLEMEIDGSPSSFSWLWLRDHSQTEADFHPVARQRLYNTFAPLAPAPPTVEVADIGSEIVLRWDDSAPVVFTADYLVAVDRPDPYRADAGTIRTWSGTELNDRLSNFTFGDVLESDRGLHDLLGAIAADGLALIDHVPLEMAQTRVVLERIGYVRSTIFGTMWSISSDGTFDDTASTELEITPHTDGTYSHDAPGILGFHCHRPADLGGENVLIDGFRLAEIIASEHPDSFDLLASTEIPWQYIGDGSHLIAHKPVIRVDPNGSIRQISYNNHDRAPFHLPDAKMNELYEALAHFDELIRSPEHRFALGLEPGSMLLFDNWRLLHGRRAFSGPRYVTGGYLNREDFESRLRRFEPNPLDMG